MRAILFHCTEVNMVVTGLATRPKDIVHGILVDHKQSMKDCVLVFVTIEEGDSEEKVGLLSNDILKFVQDTKHTNVFVTPFAHLSNKLAKSQIAIQLVNSLIEKIESSCNVQKGHFGSDKELDLHLFGHPGNTRYREY